MKKILISSIVAVAVLAGAASAFAASGYVFSNYLTVGSTGADVTALQNWLIANNFSIPSISSGAAQTGYFGQQTKAAVIQYQTSVGLPSTGFVGPLTIAKLNGSAGAAAMTPASTMCPVGYSCTPIATTAATCPVGLVCTPAAGTVTTGTMAPSGTISTPGVAGTLSLSLWSTPSNGTSVYKGQSYDIVTYKVQAGASDMLVSNLALDFSDRLWLYAGTITVRDDSGATVGQVTNLNDSNFTELTVGSDYRITVPINNYVVRAAQTKYFTVNISFLPTSDRCSGSSCTLYVTRAQIQSVDGTGVTDTEVVGDTTTTGANAQSFSYNGASSGQLVVTQDSASPLQGLVQISTAAQTQDVPLAIYDVKSENNASTLQSLTLGVFTNGTASVASTFSNIKIKAGGLVYAANTIGSGVNDKAASSTVTFTNLVIPLPADTYVPITVTGTVTQDTNNTLDGVTASTTFIVGGAAGNSTNNPVVVDQSYNNLAVNAGTFTSSNLTFSASSATLTAYTVSPLVPITSTNGSTKGYSFTMGFTVTAGSNTLYISSNPSLALATSSSGFGAASSSTLPLAGMNANPGNIAGDTAVTTQTGYYIVTAGSSRTFTFAGSVDNTNGVSGVKSFSITAVNYGTSSSALTADTINYNLNPLKVNPAF